MCNTNMPAMNGGGGSQPWDESIPGVGGTSASPAIPGWLQRHLALTKSRPVTVSGPTPDFTPGQGTTTDPQTGLQAPAPGQITQAPGGSTSQTVVGEQKSPTKLANLIRILGPVLEGGLAGWAGGKGTPGGGWNAAQQFFDRRRQLMMQQALLQRQAFNDYIQNQQRLAEAQYYSRGGPVRQAQPVIGKNGNYWTLDPVTRQLTDTGVPAQGKPPKPDQTQLTTDSGGNAVVVDRSTGTAKPVVMEGSGENGASETATGLPVGMPSGKQEVLNAYGRAAARAGLPTTPPGSTGARATSPGASPGGIKKSSSGVPLSLIPKGSASSRLEDEAVTDLRNQHPDWSNAQILHEISRLKSTRENNGGTITPAQERTLRSQFATREESSLRQLQSEQEKDLDNLSSNSGGDQLVDQKDVAAIQTKYDKLRQDLHSRMVEEAAGMGIDLTEPMVSRGVPRSAPGANRNRNNASRPQRGATRLYQGVPFTFNGSQWVRQQGQGAQ